MSASRKAGAAHPVSAVINYRLFSQSYIHTYSVAQKVSHYQMIKKFH